MGAPSDSTTKSNRRVVKSYPLSQIISTSNHNCNLKQQSKMNSSNMATKKFFLDKKFYFHVRFSSASHVEKTAELIKVFGGQIEQFLDNEVTYVLTDVPRTEWPPNGKDSVLETARSYKVKLMCLQDLLIWCSKYISSQSSSDEDDETRANTKLLQQPFMKFEDFSGHYAPTVKEFVQWPELNINTHLRVGKSLFSDSSLLCTPNHSMNTAHHPNISAQPNLQAAHVKDSIPNRNNTGTPQPLHTLNPTNVATNMTTTIKPAVMPQHASYTRPATQPNQPQNSNNNMIQPRIRRKNSIYCEICSTKITDKIEDHIQSQAHRLNTDKLNWSEVNSVIESLPSLSTLNMRRLTNITPPKGVEHQEFLCLHKVDSVSQLFFNSNKDFQSIGSLADRKLVHIL